MRTNCIDELLRSIYYTEWLYCHLSSGNYISCETIDFESFDGELRGCCKMIKINIKIF